VWVVEVLSGEGRGRNFARAGGGGLNGLHEMYSIIYDEWNS
jgi:hypothetical protein